MDVLITPEQIEKYEQSQEARVAVKLFGEYMLESCPPLNRNDYCSMREYLFWQISLQNTHRSGVCANMTIEEFKTAGSEGDLIRIKVKKHKTARVYGPAKLYLQNHVFRYLKIFVEKIRPQIIGSSPYAFVSFNGVQMTSGQISKQINATWQRAGVYGDMKVPNRNVSCTILRKSASTAVLEHNPEVSKDVADLLAHSEKTQQRYYNVRRRELSTARGAQHVGNLLRYKTINPDDKGGIMNNEPMSATKPVTSISPKKKWTPDEIKEIETLFADNIKEEMVTMEMVNVMKCDFQLLKGIPLRKIYWKIRSLWKTNHMAEDDVNQVKEDCIQVTEETEKEKTSRMLESFTCRSTIQNSDEDYIPPSVSSASCRNEKLFNEEQVDTLKKLCRHIIDVGPISKKGIKSALGSCEEGGEMLRSFNINSIVNRLKYERKCKRGAGSCTRNFTIS